MTESGSITQEVIQDIATSQKSVTISQGALDGLIGDQRRAAAEKERAKVAAEYESKLQQLRDEARTAAEQTVRDLDRQRLETEQKRQKDQQDADLIARNQAIKDRLVPKFAEGDKKYDDWKETVGSYNWQREEYAQILPLLAEESIENPEDVLHHLCDGNHIEKLSSKNPAFILNKLKEISESLKGSKKDQSFDHIPEPIKSLKPSHVKTKGDGNMTMQDFKKAKWLKC